MYILLGSGTSWVGIRRLGRRIVVGIRHNSGWDSEAGQEDSMIIGHNEYEG